MCGIFKGFNSSIWHALWVLLTVWVGVFLWAFFSLKKGHHYFFDPKHNTDSKLEGTGDFEPHAKRYQDLARLAITLSAAVIAFLINILANDKGTTTAFVQKIQLVAPIVVGYFGSCIALLIVFMVVQTVHYEEYCHSPDHDTYTRWKYALNQSVGWTGFISFILGFVWLAQNVFNR
jgi:hypothetical protein